MTDGRVDPVVVDVVRTVRTEPERTVYRLLRTRGPLDRATVAASVAGRSGATVERCLDDLRRHGLVRRTDDSPRRYALTEAGAALGVVLDRLDEFEARHARSDRADGA